METKILDGDTFKRMLEGGAEGIRAQVSEINELNVFPVPDGDTGTNMSKTMEGGIAKIQGEQEASVGDVAAAFAKGSLLGARGNSGVILSQFIAGVSDALADKETATAEEFADAYLAGVKRAYAAVSKPVEGTMLTVFRESAEYVKRKLSENSTIEDVLSLNIKEAKRSLERTKELLPVLAEADVVDSGGAGYLCIAIGMYEALMGNMRDRIAPAEKEAEPTANYDLFTTDSTLDFGYCTECLVRLQRAKGEPEAFQLDDFTASLTALGCDSIVALRDGDVLKVHAHTKTPADILTLCQKHGEFLNVKIENMSLQHSEKEAAKVPEKKKPHKPYGVVAVANGEGMVSLFEGLGADVVIDGGQTENPSTEDFINAFGTLNVDHILVLPNNGNILLTAGQAADLWEEKNVTVVPTKTLPQGYAALAVFNASITDPEEQLRDMITAKESVVSGEVTVAIRDAVINGIEITEGEAIGILDGKLVCAAETLLEALCEMIEKIEDIEDRELLTLFVGRNVTNEEANEVAAALEERFDWLSVETAMGGQNVYQYLIAVE